MKTERELKEIREKLKFIMEDEFLHKELVITSNQMRKIRIKIGMINSILEKEEEDLQ